MKCRTILHSLILIQGLCNIGAYVNLTVIDGLLEKGVFECNTPVIFTCRVTPNSLIVQWSVGKPIGPFSDSDCLGNICANSSKFPGRYHYTYNQSTGISYLNILNATFDDDQMIYQCTSGSETDSYRAPIVKAPPKDNTTVVNVDDITPNGVTAKMSTGCIYPLQDLSLLWYSTLVNGSGFQNYSVNLKSVACPPTSACARANTSVEGVLRINTTRSGQERIFYVNISFGSVYISRFIGKYNVNEVSVTNKSVCDKSKCLPCWAFGVILEGIVCIAIIVVFIVHISGAFANDTTQMNVLKGSLISIVVLAHIVVILVARFCKDESNCTDIICLPCWVYWVIQNGVIVATIACVILVNVLCDEVKTGFCYWTLYAIVGIATHVVIILAAEYCTMWDTIVEKRCLPCWVYGSILAGIILVVVVCAISIKACYPDGRIGGLWYWEMFALAGFFIVTIYLVFVVIFAGACKKNDEIIDESFGCWAIYLVIFGIIVISITCCMFIYVFIEPVRSAKVISRKVDGKGMSIRVLWESRLTDLKTYYIRLECKGKMLDPIELDHKYRQDGFLEYELTGLILDTDYQARLYSVVCKLPSLKNQITFDTKGRPMPPTKIYQDEQMRTEDSITLRWTAAKGPEHHFVIKYKRSKRQNSEWVNSKKVSSIWYTIDGLRPGTSYTIIVYAENTVGRSEESEPLFVKTRALKPVPPQQFKCTSSTENEVHLSWKPSKKLKKQQFLLTVYNNSGDGTKHEQETRIEYSGEQTMTHTVSQLNPGCKYQFEIFTSAGNVLSESSKIVNVETKGIRKEQLNDLKQTTTTTVFNLNNEK